MKATIIITAILQILGALVVLLFGVITIKLPMPADQVQKIPYWSNWAIGGCMIAFGALAVTTAIGLLRYKNWARIMTQVFGVGILFYGIFAAVGAVVGVLMSPGLNPSALAMTLAIVGLFIALWIALGLWWILGFRRSKMAPLFPQSATASPRPLSITLIALNFLMAPMALPWMLYYPAFPLMGFLLEGTVASVVTTLWVGSLFVLGIGLWRLKEWARLGSLVLMGIGLLSVVVNGIFPDAYNRYMSMASKDWATSITPMHGLISWISILSGVVFFGVVGYFLIARRQSFQKS